MPGELTGGGGRREAAARAYTAPARPGAHPRSFPAHWLGTAIGGILPFVIAVLNVHERALPAPPVTVGTLIDGLGSGDDRLWPPDWPPIRFDGPLAVGVAGGHGPVRYVVSHYVPGQWVRFRFTGPRGFDGFHEFGVERLDGRCSVLRHTLVVRPRAPLWPVWALFFRPLHDTVFRECLDRAERALTGKVARPVPWSRYVRLLRALTARLAPHLAAGPRQACDTRPKG